MSSRSNAPSNTNLSTNSSSLNMSNQGRGGMNSSFSPWRSPSYRPPRQNFYHSNNPNEYYFSPNSGPRNTYRFNNFQSPRNNFNSFRGHHSSNSSTPNRSFSGSDSGFSPSPRPDRGRFSPYYRGGNWNRNRRSFNRSFQREKANEPVEVYFKPSMLEDPWKNFKPSPNFVDNDSNSSSKIEQW